MSNMENYNNNQLKLIRTNENVPVDLNTTVPYPGDYIRITLFQNDRYAGYQFFSNKQYEGDNEIKIYEDINGISVKPNEVLEQNYVSEGNYTLQFDFLRNIFTSFNDGSNLQYADGKFYITEISPSRKEIRLIARNYETVSIDFSSTFQNIFNSEIGTLNSINDGYKDYTFDWVVTFDEGVNIPIVNTTFDDVSSEEVTLIIRLNKPIPTSVEKLTTVGIEKEVVTTQKQEIYYVSNIKSETIGSSLEPDIDSWSGEYTPTTDYEQNYEELIQSSSFTEMDLQRIESEQDVNVNLNIDYNKFKNHTHFGSAVSKLENFKTKVIKIENYLNEISNSLNVTGSMTGSYIPKKRKTAFDNITKVIKTFTPYEKFMYYDNQNTTTASAPGIGDNYAFSTPVKIDSSPENKILSNYDGFKVVFKHTDSASAAAKSASYVDLTTGMYMVHEAPFYNYSGSVYLSFLMKGDKWINNRTRNSLSKLTLNGGVSNANGYDLDFKLPSGAYHSSSVLEPALTESKYQRFIFKASQSYWRPSGSATGSLSDGNIQYVSQIEQDSDFNGPFWDNSSYWQILSSSVQIASASMTASSFPIVLPDSHNELGSHYTASDVPFTGSVLPAGELFRLHWFSHDSASKTSSFMTDVKITLKNPINAKPFAQLYSTSSVEWQNWYNGMYSSASEFDASNIHSLKHNLPEKIISGSPDVIPFINMWGEHFDGIRNYIDTYKTFYNRGYDDYESVPKNLLPVLADNLGWELINPFTGSLSTYFNSVSGSTENVKNLTHNTWLKLLNNLVYIYKSKGTMASVRALLNVYGYPPDLISLRQFGGASSEQNPRFIDDTPTTLLSGLGGISGNVSFYSEPKITYVFNPKNESHILNTNNKVLKAFWKTNNAPTTTQGIEFNMVPQIISGAGSNTNRGLVQIMDDTGMLTGKIPWGIWMVRSGSSFDEAKKVRLEFCIAKRSLHNSIVFSVPGNTNGVSCSTDWFEIGGGKLFNVSLFQMTKSANMTDYTQSYEIRVARKEDDKIVLYSTGTLNTVTQSVHENWNYTGSHQNNLYLGTGFAGSIFDFRLWENALSHSKTKQHTLNPFSVVGNNVNSLDTELVYRFRLNEGYDSGSTSGSNVLHDATPNNTFGDFSHTMSFNCNNLTYTKKLIDVTKFSPRTDGIGQRNDNFLVSDVSKQMITNLNPVESSFKPVQDVYSDDNNVISNDIEFVKSPTDTYDDYISDILADKDITQYFAKWDDLYEPAYNDLDVLRDKIYSNISVNINEYIAAQANLFNPSILEAIQSLLPAQSKFISGVTLKQSLLERTKIKHIPATLKEYVIYQANISNFYDLNDSVVTDVLEETIDFTNDYHSIQANDYTIFENTAFSITNHMDIKSTFELVTSDNINLIDDALNINASMSNTYLGNIDERDHYSFNFDFINQYQILINTKISDLTSEYVSTLNFNTLDIPSFVNISMNDNSPFLSNKITTHVSNINSNMILIPEKIIPIIDLYYNYTMSNIDVLQSNSITLISETENYSMIFQNIYESNTLDLQDYMVYSMNLLNVLESNKLNYPRDIINYSMLFQNVYESNILNIQSWIDYSMKFLNIPQGDISTLLIETPLIKLQEIYQATLEQLDVFKISAQFVSKLISNEINLYGENEINYSINLIDIPSMTLEDWSLPIFSTEYLNILNINVPDVPYETMTATYIEPLSHTITHLSEIYNTHHENIHQNWGTGSNNTHFINWNDSGSNNDYNTEYQSPHIFYDVIGDFEQVSESRVPVSCSNGTTIYQVNENSMPCYSDYHCEATDWRCHYGQKVVNDQVAISKGMVHKSYQASSSVTPVSKNGRVIGRTAFFHTASDGTIIYPANHWRNYHTAKDQMENLYYGRTKFYVDTIDSNGNVKQAQKAFRTQFLNGKDAFPDEQVYGLKIEGSDTDNILRVERPGDRPKLNETTSGSQASGVIRNRRKGGGNKSN